MRVLALRMASTTGCLTASTSGGVLHRANKQIAHAKPHSTIHIEALHWTVQDLAPFILSSKTDSQVGRCVRGVLAWYQKPTDIELALNIKKETTQPTCGSAHPVLQPLQAAQPGRVPLGRPAGRTGSSPGPPQAHPARCTWPLQAELWGGGAEENRRHMSRGRRIIMRYMCVCVFGCIGVLDERKR